MNPIVYDASLLAGIAMVATGSAIQFGAGVALMVTGGVVLVGTFVSAVLVRGRG